MILNIEKNRNLLKLPPHWKYSLWKYAPAQGYFRPLTSDPPKIKLVAVFLLNRGDLIFREHEALAKKIYIVRN
jgi:hypothetical protein